jgi:hypothetical protein
MTEENNGSNGLPKSTAPKPIRTFLRGFDSNERADAVANAVATAIHEIGRYIDVSDLDGVTIAYDYDAALAELDRGLNTPSTLTRTSNDRILGVAMAPAVLRDDKLKSHLVISGDFASEISSGNPDEALRALYLIAHECGHVEDRMLFDRRFPGVLLRARIPAGLDGFLFPTAESLWSEYAACISSAQFSRRHIELYIDGVVRSAETVRDDVAEMVARYRIHADLHRLLDEAGPRICEPLCLSAYLLGHLDGLDEGWDQAATAKDALERAGYWPIVERTGEDLRSILQAYETWESLTIFDPLKARVLEAFALNGLHLSALPEGFYVDVP